MARTAVYSQSLPFQISFRWNDKFLAEMTQGIPRIERLGVFLGEGIAIKCVGRRGADAQGMCMLGTHGFVGTSGTARILYTGEQDIPKINVYDASMYV